MSHVISNMRIAEVPCSERIFNSCGDGPFAKVQRKCPSLRKGSKNGNYYCSKVQNPAP